MNNVDIVNADLADSKAMMKNREQVNFDVSIRVFVHGQLTPVTPTTRSNADRGIAPRFDEIKTRFQRAREKYDCRKKEQTKPNPMTKGTVNHCNSV